MVQFFAPQCIILFSRYFVHLHFSGIDACFLSVMFLSMVFVSSAFLCFLSVFTGLGNFMSPMGLVASDKTGE